MKLKLFLSCLALASSMVAEEPPQGFKAIFNGTDLHDWNGEPGRWSVEDGAITGTVVPENPLKTNSFLIYQGGQPANFELRLKVRWPRWEHSQGFRNSGIQIRSVVLPGTHPWSVGGYQFDLSPGGELDGMFYEERSQRGLGVHKGESVVIQPDGERWRLVKFADDTQLRQLRRPETEWSACSILAVGNQITFSVNGTRTMELVDHDDRYRRLSGIIALQSHVGGAMKVQFKDVWLRELPAVGIATPAGDAPAGAVNAGAESLRQHASNLLKSHDPKTLAGTVHHKPGFKRVWPADPELRRLAAGDAASVALVSPSAADIELWNKLAVDNSAEWLERPRSTLVTRLPDGSEARMPVASVHGRYLLAALGTGSPELQKHDSGLVPLDGKPPEAIPLVVAGPQETKRNNIALHAKASASSEESDKGNTADKAVDGKGTRWCPAKGQSGEWLNLDLGKIQKVTGYRVSWEDNTAAYRHKVEVSKDNQTWELLADASAIDASGPHAADCNAEGRYVRITFLGQKQREHSFGSIREFEILGTPETLAKGALRAPVIPDNHPDAEWLKDLGLPEGFSASIFARPPAVSYPIFVSATPDGTLFVGCDGNGSGGRDKDRGRILRLRDLDGDGRADESRVFATIDSPRGVAVDGNKLYVLHPPDLSVFTDKDDDGIADERRTLVKGIGFGIDNRVIDHASNGIEIGVDGWIYCAIGDFGMLNAEGVDGRKLTLRGGGVVRVRTDGTGLELYSRGTRNILEAAVSPLLDVFARDNTNDGDGWEVRFHHATALGEHGYPTLFKNFTDETIPPLAIYGGGSGMGSAWIEEPGIGREWNNAPFTCDWGRNLIYRHGLTPKGATFATDQREFFRATRVNDLDVDASGRLYIASWKGANFSYVGPEAGYLVRLVPVGPTTPVPPDFAQSNNAELVRLLESQSHRIRMAAQRSLIERGAADSLDQLARDTRKPQATRVAALFALKQIKGVAATGFMTMLLADETIAAWALRALTDREDQLAGILSTPIVAALKSRDARTRREAVVALTKLNDAGHATVLAPLLADPDPIVAHTATQAMRRLDDGGASFAIIDDSTANPELRAGAFRVLSALHRSSVVDGMLTRLAKTTNTALRRPLLTALCRLSAIENLDWSGGSWGTRPDSRGPYFSLAEWSETKRINDALLSTLTAADAEESKFLSGEFARHRIKPGDATAKLITLAKADPSLVPSLAKQFGQQSESAPANAIPLLIALAGDTKAADTDRAHAIRALSNVDDPAAQRTSITMLGELHENWLNRTSQGRIEIEGARGSFFNSTKLDNQHAIFEKAAAVLDGKTAVFADVALIKIAGRKFGSPEPRDAARLALQGGLQESRRALQIMEAMRLCNDSALAPQLLPLLTSTDGEVVKAAKQTFGSLKLDPAKLSATATAPAIASLKSAEVIAAVVQTKGDAKRGEQLFAQQGCVACHTVKLSDPLKGPYLGNIANTYQRPALAEAILEPNKTIAQGFATNTVTLKNGGIHTGFVTFEAADRLLLRNIASEEVSINTADIAKREKSESVSLMPPGLVHNLSIQDFASLLDYLEALAKEPPAK
jgi:putative membrane-bound dehydrogenase-like protein